MENFKPNTEKNPEHKQFKNLLLSGRHFLMGLAFMKILAPSHSDTKTETLFESDASNNANGF